MMKVRCSMGRVRARLVGGALLIFFSPVLNAAPPREDPRSASFAEMSMRVADEGLTHAEILQWQIAINQTLTMDMPPATLEAPIAVDLTQEELDSLDQTTPLVGEPLQVGFVREVSPALIVSGFNPAKQPLWGALGAIDEGGYVWSVAIGSARAGAVRIHLEDVSLPDGAELYFYSQGHEAFGPYIGAGPLGTGEFWTESVYGAEGILQLRVTGSNPEAALKRVNFAVTEVGHIGSRFINGVVGDANTATSGSYCGNPSCVLDASCFNVAPANPAKNAVALMEWIQGAFIYTCSGGLINDNNPSQNNYFITANHCVSKNNVAQNVEFYWQFDSTSCKAACPQESGWPLKTVGSTLRKTGKTQDFTLLQLNSNPPAGSVLLGWTTAPVAFTNGLQLYRISCPNFGGQVYSQHNVDTSAPTCSGWSRGPRIYSRDITGAINGGSSGSPVINGSSQIVGQLSGTCGTNPNDPCASGPGEANATVDGAFASYYSLVQPFLNP